MLIKPGPAAFGRLCVETFPFEAVLTVEVPAAFGRLCVETAAAQGAVVVPVASRLRAAVC